MRFSQVWAGRLQYFYSPFAFETFEAAVTQRFLSLSFIQNLPYLATRHLSKSKTVERTKIQTQTRKRHGVNGDMDIPVV